jgi:energy-coupling factor transporter ATP-binding protein EcfA2
LVVTQLIWGPWGAQHRRRTWNLAPVTIVTGPTGVGKSQLLRALLVLRQSVEQPAAPAEGLQWRGRWVQEADGRLLQPAHTAPLTIGLEVSHSIRFSSDRKDENGQPKWAFSVHSLGWEWEVQLQKAPGYWGSHTLWVDGAPLARWDPLTRPVVVREGGSGPPLTSLVTSATLFDVHPTWDSWRPLANSKTPDVHRTLVHTPLTLAGPYTHPASLPDAPAPPVDGPDMARIVGSTVEVIAATLRERTGAVLAGTPSWPPPDGWSLGAPDGLPLQVLDERLARVNALLAAAGIPSRIQYQRFEGTPPDTLLYWTLRDPSGRERPPALTAGSVRRLVQLAWMLSAEPGHFLMFEVPEAGIAPDLQPALWALLAVGCRPPYGHQYLLETHHPTALVAGLAQHEVSEIAFVDLGKHGHEGQNGAEHERPPSAPPESST